MRANRESGAARKGLAGLLGMLLAAMPLVYLGATVGAAAGVAAWGPVPETSDVQTPGSGGTYAVTFEENGLPADTPWGVVVNGTPLNSSVSQVETNLSNGSYAYTQLGVAGYVSPQQASFVVNGTATVVAVDYVPVSASYAVLATSITSALVTEPPSVAFNVTTASNLLFLLAVSDYLGGGGASLVVNGAAVPFTEANVIPGLYGPNTSLTAAYVLENASGSFSAQVNVSETNQPDAILSVVAVPTDESFQFATDTAESHATASLPSGLEGYLYAGAAVNEPITGNGSLLGGGYPIAPNYNTTVPYYAGVSEGYGPNSSVGLQSNYPAGDGMGLNDVGLTLVGIGPVASVTFPVSFAVSGLPASTMWGIVLNGTARSTTGTEIQTNLTNGTYAFAPLGVAGYSTLQGGWFVVGGSAVEVAVTYVPVSSPYQVLATALTSALASAPPTVSFNVSAPSNVLVLASAGGYLSGGSASLSVNGVSTAFSTQNVIPGLFGANRSVTAAYVMNDVTGTYRVQLAVTMPGGWGTAILSVIEIPASLTFQFSSTYAQSQVEATLPAGMAAYFYAGAAVDEPITGNGSLLGGGYPTAANYATSVPYYASVSEGYGPNSSVGLQSNYPAGDGMGLNDVGVTLVGVVAPTSEGSGYPVTFAEEGLPSGIGWGVLVNGEHLQSSETQLQTNLTNGTYAFAPLGVAGYSTLQGGWFVVGGSAVEVAVTYVPVSSPYQVLATALTSALASAPPTVSFNVSAPSNVLVLASAGGYLSGGSASLSVNGVSTAFSTQNVIPGLFGANRSVTAAYVMNDVTGTYRVQLAVTMPGGWGTAILSVIEIPTSLTFQFLSNASQSRVGATLPAGMAAYFYAGAAVDEPITGNGSLLGGGYPTAANYATSVPYYASVSEGYGPNSSVGLQSNYPAGDGMGLNDVGLTLAGIAAPTASGFVTLSGSLSPSNASLVLNGVVAYVNASGAFLVSVVPGTYAVSVSAYGYFPFGEELPVLANTEVHFALVAEAAATSTRTEGTITATGYNVTITGLASAVGSISVDFTADSAGRLLVVVPYLAVQNVTIGEFLASRVYVDGTAYTNFTITLNSSYVVTLSVFGLSGDPALLWALSPAVGPGAPTSSPTFLGLTGDLGYYLLGGAVAVTVAAAVGVLLARRGRSPPAPPPADPGASGSSGEAIAAADDSLGDVLTPWYARPAARPAGK